MTTTDEAMVTDEMVEAGLQYYSEGGCSGLDDYERREVVRSILEAALSTLSERGEEEERNPAPSTHLRVTDGMVEKAAAAYWLEIYGRHRKSQQWPKDVHGGSEQLFRNGCRAALEAALSSTEDQS